MFCFRSQAGKSFLVGQLFLILYGNALPRKGSARDYGLNTYFVPLVLDGVSLDLAEKQRS
jgi:hypothetical protein